MSQFGMQMPGGRQNKGAAPDVYTALMFLGVVAMGVAVAMLWVGGMKLAPKDSAHPLIIQEPHNIKLDS
ncbi:MAG: hypothetical protein JKX70_10465 [Phycisphaerales bacterium]|nr:hypothetical protein [Phycisphaerales bacterium]